MMSAIPSMLHWVCLCLLMTVTAGHTVSTTTTAPCAGEEKLEELKQMLNTVMQQAAPCSYSVVGSGSDLELQLVKNKLLTLETKLEATETNLEVKETKQQATETILIAMETKLEAMETKQQVTETKLEATETKLEATETKLEATETALQATRAVLTSKMKGGSTFVRWGRTTCTNSSQRVYSGVAGGGLFDHTGSAANHLCLTMSPQFDGTPVPSYHGYLYGAEYENIPNHHDHDVPCSVCRATQSTTIMIPATQDCPTGWTIQYTGRLASEYYNHKAATEYVCLDGDLEDVPGGHENKNGNLFRYTVTVCGSLPCPPYVGGKIVLCVVCSK